LSNPVRSTFGRRAAAFCATILAFAICIGGAASNALDRVIYGQVADFFHFHLGDWSFYIFNVADAAITLGVGLLLLDLLGVGGKRAANPA